MPASVHTTPDAGATPRLDDSVCFNTPANTEIYTLPLRHSLPIFHRGDGTTSPGTVVSAGGNNFQVNAPTHTYGEEGSFSVTVDVTHETAATLTEIGRTHVLTPVTLKSLIPASASKKNSAADTTTAITAIA